MSESDLVLTSFDNLQDAETVWRELAAAQRHYVFQSYDWLSLWNRTSAEAEQTEPFIVCVTTDAGRPTLLWPLGIRHRYSCRTLTFLGGDVTDYNAPLADPRSLSEFGREAMRGLWRRIVGLARPDVVRLSRMPGSFADGAANPMIMEEHALHTDNAYAATPLPGTFAAFAADRSKTYFADTRRKRRKLDRLGAVTLEIAQTQPEIDTIVAVMLRQKRRRIAESSARPMPAQHEQFYRQLAGSTIAEGRPHVAALRVNGALVATHLGVLHENRFYWLMPGYESGEWARLSVGRALLQCLLEWCIANGVESFDMTVGDEEYKRFWSDRCLHLYESHYATTWRGAGLLAARRMAAARPSSEAAERSAVMLRAKTAPGDQAPTQPVDAENCEAGSRR